MGKKIVRYNGGKKYIYPCDKPTELVTGQEYEVTKVIDGQWHKEYRLKGVKGCFNAEWFDDVEE